MEFDKTNPNNWDWELREGVWVQRKTLQHLYVVASHAFNVSPRFRLLSGRLLGDNCSIGWPFLFFLFWVVVILVCVFFPFWSWWLDFGSSCLGFWYLHISFYFSHDAAQLKQLFFQHLNDKKKNAVLCSAYVVFQRRLEPSGAEVFSQTRIFTVHNIQLTKSLTLPVVFSIYVYLRNDCLKFIETWHLSWKIIFQKALQFWVESDF